MKTKQLSFKIDDDLYQILKSYADETRRSMTQLLVDYILSLPLRESPTIYQLKQKQGSE